MILHRNYQAMETCMDCGLNDIRENTESSLSQLNSSPTLMKRMGWKS